MFTGDLVFAIRNVYVHKHSSLYADQNNLDMFFYFYDNLQIAVPVVRYYFLYNAYTINTPKPFNLRYSVANWYGGFTIANDGKYLPTFVRIAGFFNTTEVRGGTIRLAIFFTGLELFSEDAVSYNAACTSSVGTTPTTC